MGVALPTSVDNKPYVDISGPYPFAGETDAAWETRKASITGPMTPPPAGPVGSTFLGKWRVGGDVKQGYFFLVDLELAVADFARDGFDKTALLSQIGAGDTITIESPSGGNTVTVDTVADLGGYFGFYLSDQAPTGILYPGELANLFWTAA
jgi:hypothetical protein